MKSKSTRISDTLPFAWQDQPWLDFRKQIADFPRGQLPIPLNIYEVHLETFHQANGGESISFGHGADMLAPYAKHMGYTHIELFGVMDLPSMVPSAFLGGEEQFCNLVNHLHRCGLGVFIRVPLIFERGHNQAQSDYYLLALLRWIEQYHVDGIHIKTEIQIGMDMPTVLSAIADLVAKIKQKHPDILMMDEGLDNASLPVEEGGLGYDLQWSLEWRNALAEYLSLPPYERKEQHKKLVHSIHSDSGRGFILPLSHSFVAKGNKSLLAKAEGSYEEKFSQFKTAFMLNMTRPGKKLMFMGNEYGPFTEWDRSNPLEWYMLDFPAHRAVREYVAAFNRFYLTAPELWELDDSEAGSKWIYPFEAEKNFVAYKRFCRSGSKLIVVLSFSDDTTEELIPAKDGCRYEYVFETANNGQAKPPIYPVARTTQQEGKRKAKPTEWQLSLTLPPMSGIILRECEDNDKTIY